MPNGHYGTPSSPRELALQRFLGTQHGASPEEREAGQLRVASVILVAGSISLTIASLLGFSHSKAASEAPAPVVEKAMPQKTEAAGLSQRKT